jgi:hypothetical protein
MIFGVLKYVNNINYQLIVNDLILNIFIIKIQTTSGTVVPEMLDLSAVLGMYLRN